MKVEYSCEVCGKRFATPEGATECEAAHKAQEKRDELKEKSSKAISELINKHYETFKEFPHIEVSEEIQKAANDEATQALEEAFSHLGDFLVEMVRGNKQ